VSSLCILCILTTELQSSVGFFPPAELELISLRAKDKICSQLCCGKREAFPVILLPTSSCFKIQKTRDGLWIIRTCIYLFNVKRTTIYLNISSKWKSHLGTRHRWTKPLISVGYRIHVYVSNHMKTKQINTPPTTHSNQLHLFHDSSRQQYGYIHHSLFYRTYCIFRRIYIINNNCNFNLVYRYSLSVNLTLSITV
jgi:hypothetical protein